VYVHGCGGTAGKFLGWCPQRVLLNGEDGDTKSRAGRRAIGLPDQLAQLLREHKTEQERMQKHARQLWQHGGWVHHGH
jgi:integrase